MPIDRRVPPILAALRKGAFAAAQEQAPKLLSDVTAMQMAFGLAETLRLEEVQRADLTEYQFREAHQLRGEFVNSELSLSDVLDTQNYQRQFPGWKAKAKVREVQSIENQAYVDETLVELGQYVRTQYPELTAFWAGPSPTAGTDSRSFTLPSEAPRIEAARAFHDRGVGIIALLTIQAGLDPLARENGVFAFRHDDPSLASADDPFSPAAIEAPVTNQGPEWAQFDGLAQDIVDSGITELHSNAEFHSPYALQELVQDLGLEQGSDLGPLH